MSRPFTDQERALLLHLIVGADDEDVFRRQIASSEYGDPWFPGSQSFGIIGAEVADAALLSIPRRIASVHDRGPDPKDRPVVGEMLIWVADGVITDLEYAWMSDTMPTNLPSLEQVIVED